MSLCVALIGAFVLGVSVVRADDNSTETDHAVACQGTTTPPAGRGPSWMLVLMRPRSRTLDAAMLDKTDYVNHTKRAGRGTESEHTFG